MKGLIYRDITAYFRRTPKFSWILDGVFLLFFIFALKNAAAVPTYLLLVQPINISGTASTLKELDTSYSSRFSLTLPVSHSQQVLSRFISSFTILLVHLPENILFLLLHYGLYGSYALHTYLFYLVMGLIIAVLMTAVNVVSSFIMSLNATAIFYLITIILSLAFYLAYWFLDFNLLVILQLSSLQLLALVTVLTALCILAGYQISKKLYVRALG